MWLIQGPYETTTRQWCSQDLGQQDPHEDQDPMCHEQDEQSKLWDKDQYFSYQDKTQETGLQLISPAILQLLHTPLESM